jgi:hypothetical protein
MGSTFVDFGGQGFEAGDPILEVWLLLLVDEIDKMDSAPAWLKALRAEWHVQATAGFGFGVMPGLETFLTSGARRDVVLDLSAKAMERLRTFGPMIAKDELNAILKGTEGTIFTGDVEVKLFRQVGEYFLKLLRGELGPNETDARFGSEA